MIFIQNLPFLSNSSLIFLSYPHGRNRLSLPPHTPPAGEERQRGCHERRDHAGGRGGNAGVRSHGESSQGPGQEGLGGGASSQQAPRPRAGCHGTHLHPSERQVRGAKIERESLPRTNAITVL